MMFPEGVKAGRISKPYGLRGEVNAILEGHTGISIEPDTPLFIDIDGQRVPFFVEEVEELSPTQAIIKFEFINSLEEAREVSGCDLYYDIRKQADVPGPGEDLASLVGFMAGDSKKGPLGKISGYLPHPMNPVYIVQSERRELLIPAVKDFIEKINYEDKFILFILPEGLLEL